MGYVAYIENKKKLFQKPVKANHLKRGMVHRYMNLFKWFEMK
jgi:hypothetical protein